jgi:putative Mg2+ transporter-C (MgtC) family protein
VLLGGALGLERELKDKPAGLRTHILICAGATLFTNLSHRMTLEGGDPGRIAAQILTGIGFLGAGTILHLGGTVHGLTTAANVWMVAAIGMALGFGAYVDATAATALVLVVLVGLGRVEEKLEQRPGRGNLVVRAGTDGPGADEVGELLREAGLAVVRVDAQRDAEGVTLRLQVHGDLAARRRAVGAILRHPGVRSASGGE